jgi:hypothetical protein
MDYQSALNHLKEGKLVARTGWNGKGMFIFLVPGSTFAVNRPPLLGIFPEGTVINYLPHIDMYNAQGQVVPWLASQGDQLANDWMGLDSADAVALQDKVGATIRFTDTAEEGLDIACDFTPPLKEDVVPTDSQRAALSVMTLLGSTAKSIETVEIEGE